MAGAFPGFAAASARFYSLGAAPVLVMGLRDAVSSIALLLIGDLAPPFILVDEADNRFADICSAATSIQNNARPRSGNGGSRPP